MIKSHDGVEVPVSVLVRKDVKLDGNNPTIVFGYGAYGITENPFLNPRVYAWLERGGVYAMAHVRGGGAFGEEWRFAGRKATKPNTWKDGDRSRRIADRATATRRPSASASTAAAPAASSSAERSPSAPSCLLPQCRASGVMDMVRMETSANGVANIPEFGTVKNEEEFRALLAMSSYHHVKDAREVSGGDAGARSE